MATKLVFDVETQQRNHVYAVPDWTPVMERAKAIVGTGWRAVKDHKGKLVLRIVHGACRATTAPEPGLHDIDTGVIAEPLRDTGIWNIAVVNVTMAMCSACRADARMN